MDTLISIFEQMGAGWQIIVVLTFFSIFVEITPVKINPLTALKKLINLPNQLSKTTEDIATLEKNIENVYNRVDTIGKQVDDIEVDRERASKSIGAEFVEVNKKLIDIEENSRKNVAIQARVRILRFGDEILHGKKHSEEHFRQMMADIDTYEQYCQDNPEFQNNITVQTITLIKTTWQRCITGELEFLKIDKEEN